MLRRILSLLLLALLSLPLMAGFFAAGEESRLAPCCRKGGLHKCAMAGSDVSSGRAFTKVMRCPMYPAAAVAAGSVLTVLPAGAFSTAVAFFSRPSGAVQIEAQYRISFSRSGQKRGPPVSPRSFAC